MIYTLENETAVLSIDTHHGEISSFRRKDKDIEYMWNGDPKYWSGRNPTLFPHVSSTANKILNFKGQDCKVNNHGFARYSEFALIDKGDDKVVLGLKDDEESYRQYPYHFELELAYTLKGAQVFIDYTIRNKDEDKLYFGFGQHPAFNCPLSKDKKFSDYWIGFDQPDVEGGRLPLSYELFQKYPTYIIKDPQSRTFTLSDGENQVIMHTDDKYRIFALWTPMAPFVCLEPWVNTLDEKDLLTPFEQREGNVVLDKDESWHIAYDLTVK